MFLVSDLLTFWFWMVCFDFDFLLIYVRLPRNFNVEIYALFRRFFVTEKQTPQTVSLLECMLSLSWSQPPPCLTLPIQQQKTYHRAGSKWTSNTERTFLKIQNVSVTFLVDSLLFQPPLGPEIGGLGGLWWYYTFKRGGELIRRDHISLNWHRYHHGTTIHHLVELKEILRWTKKQTNSSWCCSF